MFDPSYGTSGYTPSHFHENKRTETAAHSRKKSLPKRVLKWALAIFAILIFFVWLLMGPFRFMFWRTAGFTGFPFGNRTYLVLFQNNYELRPTGGFISTYGELSFSHGLFSGLEFHDVYGEIDDHEFIEPPLILSALLSGEGYQGHTFRDANFDPDFTIAKDELIEFYQLTQPNARVSGVIAADFTFLEQLVGLYEPLKIEEYELTEQNLFETLSSVVSDIDRHNEEALAERKNITSPIVKKILFKSIILPWRLLTIRDLTAQAFEEKHLLASFTRSGLQKSFHARNWDGALPQSDSGDFLAINDANYGGMKSNRYITRDIQYELEVTGQNDVLGNPVVKGKVTVTLSHEGSWNIPLSGPYTSYLRTMIPLGANIENGGEITEDREDVLVLGEMVNLQPGESVSYSYSYELPEYVWSEGVYHLHLHKQPGTLGDRYRVLVHLPQGVSMESSSFEVRENLGIFEGALLTDAELSFSLLDDESSPRVVSHEITALNEITIVFNEPLNTQHGEDPANYEILDTDFSDSSVTDALTLTNIRVDGSAVILTTSGMTEQIEERYEITLRGLTDSSGNAITPNPRTLTVVLRDLVEPEEPEESEVPEEEVPVEEEPITE
ncbi:MAG: DUF4012 domain-containing protein [Candidatus Gracilibacteria bacterium]|jgi:hypothetical protein